MIRKPPIPSWRVLAASLLALSSAAVAQSPPGGAYPRPKGTHEVEVERSLMIPMRDGVKLATDIYRPK